MIFRPAAQPPRDWPESTWTTRLGSYPSTSNASNSPRSTFSSLAQDAFVRLAYHARFGKIDPEELDPNWNFASPLVISDPVSMVQRGIDNNGVGKFVDSLKPQHPFYGNLKGALLKYRAIALKGGWPASRLGQYSNLV
ncbi:MAG: hypothetical protein ACREVK_01365 [Gammaproteobacteria bacterium]